MKKGLLSVLFILIFVIAFSLTAMAASWEGWGDGWVKTSTYTELNAGSVKTGCSFCNWGTNNFMSAYQAGKLSLSGNGGYESRHSDYIKVDVSGGYDTSYDQFRNIPGGYQSSWGEQWANGSVKITSPH